MRVNFTTAVKRLIFKSRDENMVGTASYINIHICSHSLIVALFISSWTCSIKSNTCDVLLAV